MQIDWLKDVIKIALGYIVAYSPFLFPKVQQYLIKRYQLSLDKALEDKKSKNERKNHISKVRFDKEFLIYQELSENIFSLQLQINAYVSEILSGKNPDYNDIKNYEESINKSNSINQRYSPFISENIYEDFQDIIEACKTALILINRNRNTMKDDDRVSLKNIKKDAHSKRQKTINNIRAYLKTLDLDN